MVAGVARRTIGNLERGVFKTTLDTMARVADALGFPVEELLHRAGDRLRRQQAEEKRAGGGISQRR